jgi:hypothetical protein
VKFRIPDEEDAALRIDIGERQAHELAAPKAGGVEQEGWPSVEGPVAMDRARSA